ncbi:hypothetical protein BN871_BM_00410 [Paenibacillus sp. P22]|nr:hypothetical protein BN871_BM_00410 [Paenibacillus sp. P22]
MHPEAHLDDDLHDRHDDEQDVDEGGVDFAADDGSESNERKQHREDISNDMLLGTFMLVALGRLFGMGRMVGHSLPHLSHQINDGEDEYPDDVDKVPVHAGDIYLRRGDDGQALAVNLADQQRDPHDAERDVGSVEADQRIEGGTEGAGAELMAFMRVLDELVNLEAEEGKAEHDGYDEPVLHRLHLAAVHRLDGEYARQAGCQQDDGSNRHRGQLEQLLRSRVAVADLIAKRQEGGEESAEQYRLSSKEQPESENLVASFEGRAFRFMRQLAV